MTLLEFYHVLNIRTGRQAYAGPFIALAAIALKPGTAYGKGPSEQDAKAQEWRQWFVGEGYSEPP